MAKTRNRSRSSSRRSSARSFGPASERPLAWLRVAAELYQHACRADRPLDGEVAEVLRRHRALPGDDKRRAVETAYAMLRCRGFLEDARARLPFDATREATVALFLASRGEAGALPLDDGERRAMEHALSEAEAALQDLPLAERLARRTPAPAFVVEKLAARLGEESARALCLGFLDDAPVTLRVNTLKATREEARAALEHEGLATRPCAFSPVGLVLEERAPLHQSAAFRAGLFERQDEGSQLLSLLTEARPGMTVVDGCAGAGGKTLHLAALLENKGSLLALDVNRRRLDELKQRARRAGAHNVRVRGLDDEGRAWLARHEASADVVLVDAPCSGTGTLRRAPDIGWKLAEDALDRLVEQQREILDGYARLVRPGGRLVYATCSVLEEEGAEQVARFLDAHPEFQLRSAAEVLAHQGVPLGALGNGPLLRLRPDQHGTDGFFGAVLERRA